MNNKLCFLISPGKVASLQVGKKHLQHRIAHKDHAKEKHNWAGDDAKAEVGTVHYIGKRLYLAEFGDDVLPLAPDSRNSLSNLLFSCAFRRKLYL